MNAYISTGAFISKDIKQIIDIAYQNNINNIEISPGLDYCYDIREYLKSVSNDFNFLIHNYFPTPKESFALNLASFDSETVKRSMDMCKDAVDYVSELGIDYYSVHCGFTFDTDGRALGNSSQVDLPRTPYDEAKEVFTERVRELCRYAKNKNVKIALENNVVADFAKNDRECYLGVDTDDMLELLDMVDQDNAGILLDLAHAYVSSRSLGFSVDDMINRLNPYLMEVHISENNGIEDQNLQVKNGGMITDYLRYVSDVPITLEVYDISIEQIKDQIKLVESIKNGNAF